jgi:predicted dehydrogenase
MTSELKGVMVGAGFFAEFQAEAWNRLPGARITAVADLDPDKAAAFAARWNIPNVYRDAAEMLARERPDFIDIVTTPETHLALARLGAEAGVAVICQKPMAPTYEECVAMVEACERAGVRLLIHENWRWQPWYREIKRLEQAGRFGKVFHLAFRMRNGDGRGANPYTRQPYFRFMKRFLIHETLVHFLDTFRFLAGEIRSLHCRIARVNPLIAGEDYALITMTFESGAHGMIDANRISGPLPLDPAFGTFWMEGERAMVRMSPDGRLWLTDYGDSERQHPYEIPEAGYKGDSVLALQRHFIQCLTTGARCESEGRDYLRTVAAVMECYRSAEAAE